MLDKLKNQHLFVDSSQKWDRPANHCLQSWRDKKSTTENHKLSEQTFTSRSLHGNQCWGRRTLTGTGKILEAQCGRVWEVKSPGGPRIRECHTSVSFTSWSSTRLSQWRSKKNPHLLPAGGEGKGTILKQGAFCSSSKSCPQQKPEPHLLGFYQSLTTLGEGKYPTPAPSNHAIPPEEAGDWKALIKFTVEGYRLIKRPRPHLRTVECFPFPKPNMSLKAFLQQVLIPSTSCLPSNPKLQGTLIGKKTVWRDWMSIRTRVRYCRGDGIIRLGIF